MSLLVSISVENDGHVCQVKSFGYTNHHVELEADADAVDLTYYAPSGEWNLLGTWAEEVTGINYSEVSRKENGRKREPFNTVQLLLPRLNVTARGMFCGAKNNYDTFTPK